MSCYVLTIAYGRCIEGWRRSREACEEALQVCGNRGICPDSDTPEADEVRACAREMRDWSDLARSVPRFVEGSLA